MLSRSCGVHAVIVEVRKSRTAWPFCISWNRYAKVETSVNLAVTGFTFSTISKSSSRAPLAGATGVGAGTLRVDPSAAAALSPVAEAAGLGAAGLGDLPPQASAAAITPLAAISESFLFIVCDSSMP